MATQAHYIFALHVATGKTQEAAYLTAYPNASSATARANAPLLMKRDDVQEIIRDIHEAERSDTAQIRAEIIMGHLADIRNEELDAKDRRAARIALARMLGMETQVVEVKGDVVEAFARHALSRAASEPMVQRNNK